jgi:hypothetical protein
VRWIRCMVNDATTHAEPDLTDEVVLTERPRPLLLIWPSYNMLQMTTHAPMNNLTN